MPKPNPDYNPDWEALLDHHTAERTRIDKEKDALIEQENEFDDNADPEDTRAFHKKYNELDKQWHEHQNQVYRCLDCYQHKTIQDAAKWIFKNFDPSMGTHATHTLHQIDFEEFTTIHQARDAWKKANAISEQIEAETKYSLPIGQPNNLDVFQETGSNAVTSNWQKFQAEELRPGWVRRFDSEYVHTLITIDQRDKEYHICFMQDPVTERCGSMYVQNEIESLATTMYKRAQNHFKPQEKSQKTGLSYLMSELNKTAKNFINPSAIKPEQFHFYIHHPPAPHHPEKFFHVYMDYSLGEFKDAQFNQYKVIPETIQQAYKKTKMRDANIHIVAPLELADNYRGDDGTKHEL